MTKLDIWVCQGRVCTAHGSDAVAARATAEARAADGVSLKGGGCRVLRGGCYGHCEIGPNVVVRVHEGPPPAVEDDRLNLTEAANETVYSQVSPTDVALIVQAHRAGVTVPALTRDARLAALPPSSPVAQKIQALREKRRGT